MPAENGNRYAEKWTYEATMKALEKINKFAMMDDTLYLGMALSRAGYYDDIWRYWRKKWARNFAITNEMKQLSQHFEMRLFTRAAGGKIPVSLGMFALRHHYGWGKDVQVENDLNYLAEEDLTQTAVPIQTFPQGEALHTNGHLSEGEGCNTADAAVEQVGPDDLTVSDTAAVADPSTTAAIDVSDEHSVKMTPDEELLAEAGVSSIAEIERRMREEDPELGEFDDMEEDMEWEVVTPETYIRRK